MRTAISSSLLSVAGLSIWIAGCISSDTVRVGVISTRDVELPSRVLAYDIGGSDCPRQRWEGPDLGRAIDNALRKVPGANVLLDVTLYQKAVEIGKICVRVVGNAAVLE